ncbi:MAG: rhodanese-like domain-containing protein [Bacteroidetes bacterium]|nr:MAG: rhodanese-like domain-containing protein [Bacteroidota bacterium]
MKKTFRFYILILAAFMSFSSCQEADTIIEREKKAKAEIEQFTREISTWNKDDFVKNGVTIEGDPSNLPVREFYKGIYAELGVLVDIRTPKEFAQASIPDAISIDFYSKNFKEEFSKLDKEQPVFIYCRTGVRSAKATKVLSDMGYQVYNLKKGFMDWIKFGLPIEGELDYGAGEEGC